MVALAGARTIRASYGLAFSYEVQLPASLLRQVAAVRGVAVSSRVIDGFGDVTAHFVTETVTSDRRQLQVIVFFWFLLHDADMHSLYLLRQHVWVSVCHSW